MIFHNLLHKWILILRREQKCFNITNGMRKLMKRLCFNERKIVRCEVRVYPKLEWNFYAFRHSFPEISLERVGMNFETDSLRSCNKFLIMLLII